MLPIEESHHKEQEARAKSGIKPINFMMIRRKTLTVSNFKILMNWFSQRRGVLHREQESYGSQGCPCQLLLGFRVQVHLHHEEVGLYHGCLYHLHTES